MRKLSIIAMAAVIAGSGAVYGQTEAKEHAQSAKSKAKAAMTDTDATYGRVKEFTAGQKIVIDVDNAVDKTFDLNDKDLKVKLAKGLKVGDPVKVVEREVAGKTKSVMISKHSGGGVAHGDKDPAAKKP